MRIGASIIVKAIIKPYYDKRNNRKFERTVFPKPKPAFYVGYTFRCEGKYCPSSRKNTYWEEQYEEPYLHVTKTFKVIRIKFTERSNDAFVLAEDIIGE